MGVSGYRVINTLMGTEHGGQEMLACVLLYYRKDPYIVACALLAMPG
jgi:hypothetical protein